MSKIKHDFELVLTEYVGDITGNVKLMIPRKRIVSCEYIFTQKIQKLLLEYFYNGKSSEKSLEHHLEHDGLKTQALLDNGYTVVQIRENSL